MATPGITLLFSFREPAKIPVSPPKNATITSRNVGVVRDNNSLPASLMGLIKKYKAEERMAMPVATPKLPNDRLTKSRLFTPTPSPTPMMGPIKGEINMAPITTAVEFTLRPMEAMTMLNTKDPDVEASKLRVSLDAFHGLFRLCQIDNPQPVQDMRPQARPRCLSTT